MLQLFNAWSGLAQRRKMIVVLATVAMFTAVLALSRIASTPSMSLLYSGLDSTAASDVVTALDQGGHPYEIRGNSIYVAGADRDRLRLILAGEGMPANGAQGYELLDNLTGFGTTAQMFDAAYWRAKEGELARTIVASPHIRAARVHIAQSNRQLLHRALEPTASVTVTPNGSALSTVHAKALKFLVASSVAGLSADSVSVIDATSGAVIITNDANGIASGGADYAKTLKNNVERLLSAHVGAGKAVVEVNVERITDRESITERSFDPESRVAISTETQERTTSSSDNGSSAVTVASNLPEGDGDQSQSSSSSNAETRELVNFDVSETRRELVRAPGAIKRISVAVLLDGKRRVADDGSELWEPLPSEELASISELVSSAVGYDETRGDVITVKSLQFEPLAPDAGTTAAPSFFEQLHVDVMSIVQMAVLATVALVLGLFVVRPILLSAPAPALSAPQLDNGLVGEISTPDAFPPMNTISDIENQDGQHLPATQESTNSVTRLRNLIEERQDESVEILRNWMDHEEERV